MKLVDQHRHVGVCYERQQGFLVAEFPDFPGVRIPLLTTEECKERGIEQGKFPPFSTWTPEQQDAGRTLADIPCEMAISQPYRSIAQQLELMAQEGYDNADFEKEAVPRVQKELGVGTWKPPAREDVYGLERAVGWALLSFLTDDKTNDGKRAAKRRSKRRGTAGATYGKR